MKNVKEPGLWIVLQVCAQSLPFLPIKSITERVRSQYALTSNYFLPLRLFPNFCACMHSVFFFFHNCFQSNYSSLVGSFYLNIHARYESASVTLMPFHFQAKQNIALRGDFKVCSPPLLSFDHLG